MTENLDKRLHILMIAEGTYPFNWGGVSTWCHLLLRDLPNIDFTLMSLTGDPGAVPQFNLPGNVVDFRPIPLWGIRETLEMRPNLGLLELQALRARTDEATVAREFVPLLRDFLYELYADNSDPHHLAQTIHAMYRFFLSYDFDTAMRSQVVWELFQEITTTEFPRVARHHGYVDARCTLADVTTCMQWLYHWFFPLATPLPKADVIHAAMAGVCTLVAVAAKLEYGAAYMLTEHGIYLRERYLAEAATAVSLYRKVFSLRFARRMTELSYTLADQIAPCCDYNQRWELRIGARPEQIQTIYYGVDSVTFAPVEKPADTPPVVVWVGRIDPLKDLLSLLRAAAIVHAARPDIEFRLFGSAPPGNEAYYEQCLQLRAELGLEECVVFAGYRANPVGAYNEGDIAVLSSVSEAFPFAILEAMLCERPVVATAVGGVPEQIRGCGIAVEPRNPEAMAQGILQLMGDAELRAKLGKAARAKALQEYSVRQSGMAHERAYRRLAAHKPLLPNADAAPQPVEATPTQPAESSAATSSAEQMAPIQAPAIAFEAAYESVTHSPSTRNGYRNGNGTGNGHGNGNGHRNGLGSGHGNGDDADGSTKRQRLRKLNFKSARVSPTPLSLIIKGRGAPNNGGNDGNGSQQQPTEDWQHRYAAAIATLADETAQRCYEPLDSHEITALLESSGITDEVAIQYYGAPDAFALGAAVLAEMKRKGLPLRPVQPLSPPYMSTRERIGDYLKGPLAIMPPLALLLTIATFGQLGGWDSARLLVLSLGMTSSVLVSNGFVQAISRRTSLYIGMRKPELAARFVALSTAVAVGFVVSIAILAFVLMYPSQTTSASDVRIFLISFVAVSLIWLIAGSLSLLRRSAWLGIALVVGWLTGIALSIASRPFLPAYLAIGTTGGYLVTIGLILYALYQGFGGKAVMAKSTMRLPSTGYMVTEALPYWAFGALYMIFILIPHIVGWFGELAPGQNRTLAFVTMEVGLTLSLLPLAFAYGVAEHALRLFWRQALSLQVQTPGEQPQQFGLALRQLCWQQRRGYAITLSLLTVMSSLVFALFIRTGMVSKVFAAADIQQLTFVIFAGHVAYVLLGVGLFNSMFAITLGEPQTAFIALLIATGLMVAISIPLSLFSFAYAAVGFVLGALVFMLISGWMTERVLTTADFSFTSVL